MLLLNYQAILLKYDFINSDSMAKFSQKLPQDLRNEFNSIVAESLLIASIYLQAALDLVDTSFQVDGNGHQYVVDYFATMRPASVGRYKAWWKTYHLRAATYSQTKWMRHHPHLKTPGQCFVP